MPPGGELTEERGRRCQRCAPRALLDRSNTMVRKYSKRASKDVANALRNQKKGTLKRGKGGRGGAVKSRKQAIAIGLSEARRQGEKVPKRKTKK
jgi:Family of unknown function (DUF6496)